MRSRFTILWVMTLVGCGGEESGQTGGELASDSALIGSAPTQPLSTDGQEVFAVVQDATGRELGTVRLNDAGQGIMLSGSLRLLPPGAHGIHLHTTGQCTPPFETAGGHWNPTNRQHGADNPEGPHFGDLSNLSVGADSTAELQLSTLGGTLRGPEGLLDADGAALVVHARADDNRTDPSGNSGDRIACGIVTGMP